MDHMKLIGYLVCMFWCHQIQSAPITVHDCPNFSYLLGDNCYSLHDNLEFKYEDAVHHCKQNGGLLWSKTNEEEVMFLRKIKEFTVFITFFHYWIGAHKKDGKWTYLSDHSVVSDSLMKNPNHKVSDCLAIQPLIPKKFEELSCVHDLTIVCEYTGETCENNKNEGKDCYIITNTTEKFANAAQTCEQLQARIVEIRNQNQISKLIEVLRKDKGLMRLASEKVEKFDGSNLPTLWQFKPQLKSGESCEIYANSEIKTNNCNGSSNFACKFDGETGDEWTTGHYAPVDLALKPRF